MENHARATQPTPRTRSVPLPGSTPPSRRGFLLGGAFGVVAAAGVGVAVAVATKPEPSSEDVAAPAHLLAALAAEHTLLASLDAVAHPSAALRPVLRQLRADHVAHRTALRAAIALTGSNADLAASPSAQRRTPPSQAELRALEQRAATRSAGLALLLHGRDAVLMASIAACEATHAELLS